MQVDMDLPKVICSLDALGGAAAGLDVFCAAMLAPQLLQNLTSSEFSLPHFGQNILLSLPLDKGQTTLGRVLPNAGIKRPASAGPLE